ncbi:MAG: hypothetical protein KA401_01365 [Anaerolineae bacterium]|nr:hypothetical protein [Anaerolineae bacterium]
MTRNQAGLPLVTPDGRYIVVRGRLWRRSNPDLSESERQMHVNALMDARRAVAAARRNNDPVAEDQAHQNVDRAKHALGERGPVWWKDGAPDLTRHMVHTGPYVRWYQDQEKPEET